MVQYEEKTKLSTLPLLTSKENALPAEMTRPVIYWDYLFKVSEEIRDI